MLTNKEWSLFVFLLPFLSKLKHGAKICKQNKLGHFPIHAAAFAGAKKALEVILKYGTTRGMICRHKLTERQSWKHFYEAIQHIRIDIELESSPQLSFSRKMHVSLCTQARCHRLTVCLSIVGGLFGESCVVEGRLSQSTKCLWNICDCLVEELRGMCILCAAHNEWIQLLTAFFTKKKKKNPPKDLNKVF